MPLLVVDDNPSVCDLLSTLCRQAGIECRIAANGEQALQACARETFRLVITDLQMPGMKGTELARELRQRYPGLRIFCFTGSGGFGEWLEDEENGLFDGTYLKPYDTSRMIAEALKLLGSEDGG